MLLSVVCSIFLGKGENLSAAIVDSGAQTVQLLLTLAGVITLWSGIMKIAEESGLTAIFAKIFSPLLRPLFPNLDKESDAFGSITMNITANLLGLGNTATPLGLKAMHELNELNGSSDTASDELIVFVGTPPRCSFCPQCSALCGKPMAATRRLRYLYPYG